ncbi:UNVERIFIED_CONTAM: hypothetical protein FKN15_012542 [Acipenser sinensis]
MQNNLIRSSSTRTTGPSSDHFHVSDYSKVEDMYMQLCVDPHQMTQLLDLGYTEQEARLGLRACRGNLNEAANHISQRELELQSSEKKDEGEKALKHNAEICSKKKKTESTDSQLPKPESAAASHGQFAEPDSEAKNSGHVII